MSAARSRHLPTRVAPDVPPQPDTWGSPIYGESASCTPMETLRSATSADGWYRLLASHMFQAHGLYRRTYRRPLGFRQRTGFCW